MRALLTVASLALLTACTTVTPAMSPVPSTLTTDVDVSGRWLGTWIGTGLFDSPREESLTLDLKQAGYVGAGRLVFDGATAAESVPWEVRLQGLSGIRVAATIFGADVRVRHEVDGRIFAADLTLVDADRMVGDVRGRGWPGVRLLLTRVRPSAPPQARVVPPVPAVMDVPATVLEPLPPVPDDVIPAASEPTGPDPVQIAAAPPSEEPQRPDAPEARPRLDEFVETPDLRVVFFGFDSATLRPEARETLTIDAEWLKAHDDLVVTIEGHCDERGTSEYNQALGDRRAQSVKDSLEAAGVAADRLATISYGKERPVCSTDTEECRGLNRHVEFRIKSR